MAPEKKAWLGFLAGALLLLLVGASGWWCAARFLGDFQRVEHTNQVRDLVQSLLTDILEMRSTTRDFAVTGSEAVRAVYLADDARLGDSLRRLRVLTADDPAQQQRLDQLDPLVTEIRRILAERVAAKQERNVDLSRDPGHFLQGQRVIDRIRAVVEAMAADETGRLHRRLASAQTVARANLATAAGVGVLAAGLVVGAGWIARRNFWLRQRTEASLRASERRYRTLFNSLDEGFAVFEMIFDAQGHAVDYRFLEVSPSFEKQTGLRDAVGRRMRELAPGHEAHWFETYGRIALTGEPLRFQNRAEELHRWFDVYAFRLGEPEERQVAVLFSDISERRQAEAELKLRTGQLEAANQELEAFSYSVSHDLRAPLRHVNGFAGLLEKHAAGTLDEKARRYIATVRESAARMGQLIDDLLAFSRFGRTQLARSRFDHNALVAAVIRDGRYEADGPAIVWEIGALPEVTADIALLRQVWANLIGNAVKYSRHAAPARIVVAGERGPGPDPECVFSVRDNGVGFDPAYADKLFGVFQRLHSAAEFEGTGIGLANVRRIVTRHGGRTWAESQVGQGATFFFSLPTLPLPPSAPA